MPILLKKNPGKHEDKDKSPINSKSSIIGSRRVSPSMSIQPSVQASNASRIVPHMELSKAVDLVLINSGF